MLEIEKIRQPKYLSRDFLLRDNVAFPSHERHRDQVPPPERQSRVLGRPGRINPGHFRPAAVRLPGQSLLPVDQTKKSTDFPKFLAEVRRARLNESFNLWINTELNREIRNTPLYQQMQANAAR